MILSSMLTCISGLFNCWKPWCEMFRLGANNQIFVVLDYLLLSLLKSLSQFFVLVFMCMYMCVCMCVCVMFSVCVLFGANIACRVIDQSSLSSSDLIPKFIFAKSNSQIMRNLLAAVSVVLLSNFLRTGFFSIYEGQWLWQQLVLLQKVTQKIFVTVQLRGKPRLLLKWQNILRKQKRRKYYGENAIQRNYHRSKTTHIITERDMCLQLNLTYFKCKVRRL